MSTNKLSEHIVYVNPKKDCEYKHMLALGFPELSLISTFPGESIKERIKSWCAANWYHNTYIIKYFSDFAQYTPKEGTVSHPTANALAKAALEGVFEFISENLDTLSHLKTAFEFKEADTPFAPKVSKEVLEMSFADRQALLKANNAARLEEVKDN